MSRACNGLGIALGSASWPSRQSSGLPLAKRRACPAAMVDVETVGPKVGDALPEFSLRDQGGHIQSSNRSTRNGAQRERSWCWLVPRRAGAALAIAVVVACRYLSGDGSGERQSTCIWPGGQLKTASDRPCESGAPGRSYRTCGRQSSRRHPEIAEPTSLPQRWFLTVLPPDHLSVSAI